jgi:DNA-binding NarL/FixJ family response regulator
MRELTAAIAFVIDGGVYIPAGALTSGEAGHKDRGWSSIEGGAVGRLMSLTGRQREIVEHVAAGMSNREIAVALGIREGTVKVHVARILEKLGVANRLEAALAVAESRSTGDEVDGAPAGVGQMHAARRC